MPKSQLIKSLYFDSHLVNSPLLCQPSYQLTKSITVLSYDFLISPIFDNFPQRKKRNYPSSLKPDLKSRKAFIYLSYNTIISLPLTSIPPSQRVESVETYQHSTLSLLHIHSFQVISNLVLNF